MKNNNIEELTFHLYDNIKRFQINVDESLAITLALIYVIYVKQESFISAVEPKSKDRIKNYNHGIDWITDDINNDFNATFITQKVSEYIINNIRQYDIYYKVQRNIIKDAIEKLINEKSSLLQSSNRKTADFTQKIITAITKKIFNRGNYIDLAVGTGSLLKDLEGNLFGIDVNPKMVIIARIYLFFCGKYKKLSNNYWEAHITQKDAIDDYIKYKEDKNIVIFDPPMGDFRLYPKFEEWQNTKIIEKKPLKLQSELLFLISFLINANDNDYFVGLFPENILTKNNKEYNSIRKYLIENSLISVIKVFEPHVLLIGKKKLEQNAYQEIPVIRIQKNLNEKQLDFISSEIIKGKKFNFDKYLSIFPDDTASIINEYDNIESYNKDFRSITYAVYKRNDLLTNNYIINLPEKLTYEDLHKNNKETPQELLKMINDNEEEIKIKLKQINEIVSHIQSKEEKQDKFEPWFSNNRTDKINNALSYFYSKYYLDLLTEDNVESWFDFQIRDNVLPENFTNLKILFESKRVELLKNKVKIYFGENKENLQKDINWMEFYNLFDPLKDKELKCIFELTNNDENIKLIFENLCQYWMLDQNEDNTLLKQKEFSIKEFTRCLRVLENLGLVIFDKRKIYTSEQGHSEIDLYKRFIPNIKYINAIKFEESQNVR